MTLEPRQREDYSDRQIAAAHRVLVDLGQVLKSFEDCLVVIGGWGARPVDGKSRRAAYRQH